MRLSRLPIQRGTGRAFITGIKRPERESDHLPPSSYDAKNGAMNLFPPACVHGVNRDEITWQLTDLLFSYVRRLPSTCPSVCRSNCCSSLMFF